MYLIAILYDNATATAPLINHAGQIWFDLEGWAGDPIYINVETDPNRDGVLELINAGNITTLPTLLFIRQDAPGEQRIITRLEGNRTYNQVLATAQRVLAGEFDGDSDGTGTGAETKPILPLLAQNILSFPLFNINLPIPAWLWLVAAGAAGVQALSANKAGQYIWGGLAAVSLGNYYNAKHGPAVSGKLAYKKMVQ